MRKVLKSVATPFLFVIAIVAITIWFSKHSSQSGRSMGTKKWE